MGSFPKKLALEWEQDCKENFSGCRWMKAYADHCKARTLEMSELYADVLEEQEQKVQTTESSEEQKEIPTIGRKEKIRK